MMPMFMNSEVSYAKHSLPYPIFAAEFDPYNRGYLLVAGGGGEGRSGVPNRISVLDVNNRASIEPALDLTLSSDEDSVSSLASLATKDGLITFAGINSSQKDQDDGRNEHFRSFSIRYPPRKKQKTEGALKEEKNDDVGEIKSLGKRSMFETSMASKKETYQRLLRLSPVQRRDSPGKRIGAIASSLGKNNEVVVFDATNALPDASDIIARIWLPERQEASDLDISHVDQNEFSVAYCDDHNIYEQTMIYNFDKKTTDKRPKGPRRVFQMHLEDAFEDVKSSPKFRCLRFLNSDNVIALVNRPKRSGADLRIYHLYPTGPALTMAEKRLPRRITQVAANGLDVCPLDADKNGNQQYVIAVAGQDASIEVFSTNYQAATDTFSSLKSYMTLHNVHPAGITKLAWSQFISPPRAAQSEQYRTGSNGEPIVRRGPPQHPGPQYARLASVSFGNTVVVDTFPLSPLKPKDKDSRYVLSHPDDEKLWIWACIVIGSFVVLIVGFLVISFTRGFNDPDLVIVNFLPQRVRDMLDAPVSVAYKAGRERAAKISTAPTVVKKDSLRSAIRTHHASPEDAQATAVVVRDVPEGDGLEIQIHPEKDKYLEQDIHAKHWHELEDHEKSYWKEKLIRAGHWTEDEGEGLLKGVLWSTYASVVGQVGGQILREL